MGAIAGLVYADGRTVSPDETDRLAAAGGARGVDGVATWQDGPAGLVRFRHATTPEALNERQPRRADGSGWVICFDGRLDNRLELLAHLGGHGDALRARSDEDIALALFEAEGDVFLHRLTGDYALAIWVPEQQRLFCARSAAGWRAFCYTNAGGRFAFATEPRTLIRGLGLERRINEAMVAELLTQRLVTPDESLWRDLARLPQGSALEYRDGRVRVWHWDDREPEDWSGASEAAHVERFNALFDKALIATTRSPTPVVSQLSGGLDSSSVFCRATELQRAGRIAQPVSAITARFPGSPTDEGRWVAFVEQKLGVTADTVSSNVFDLDAAAAWTAESLHPPLRPNTLNTLQAAFRRVREQGGRVLLSGEGGDEFLNGSHVHWLDDLKRGRIDRVLRDGFSQEGKTFLQQGRDMLHGTIAPLLRPALYDALRRRRGWDDLPTPDWVDAQWLDGLDLSDRVRNSAPPIRLASLAAQNRYAVLESRGNEVLHDSVAAFGEEMGVEYRHPFYDRELLRFYMGASGAVLFAGGERKHLLREAMRGTLPEEIRNRRDKAIFNAQTLDGLAAYLGARKITDLAPVRFGWVKCGPLTETWDIFWRWRKDGGTAALPNAEFGALWSTAALDLWLTHAAGV